jgi:hypothetical protein
MEGVEMKGKPAGTVKLLLRPKGPCGSRSLLARLLAVLVLVLVGGPVGVSFAQESPEEQPPVRKAAPTYTDEDLARYREQRLREQAAESSSPSEIPTTTPDGAMAALPAGAGLPTALPAAVSVVLRDLNRTLPPEARERAEAAGRRFITFFEVPVEGPVVVPVRFIPDLQAFRDDLARNVQRPGAWTGYYDPMKKEIVVGGGEDYLDVLVHEVNHFIVDMVFEEAPVWLNEGLAEYFETSAAESGGLVVRDQPHHRRRLAAWLEQGRQPDLRQLLSPTGWTSLDHAMDHERLVRALSWSVVDFLMKDPAGRRTLRAVMARLKEHRGLHSLEAIEHTYPGGAAAFERQWLTHVEARASRD